MGEIPCGFNPRLEYHAGLAKCRRSGFKPRRSKDHASSTLATGTEPCERISQRLLIVTDGDRYLGGALTNGSEEDSNPPVLETGDTEGGTRVPDQRVESPEWAASLGVW